MGPIDTLVHLTNFFLPAVGVAVFGATLAKLVWRAELRTVRWTRLAASAGAGGSAVLLAGLVFFGRDGRMATYGAMVAAASLALMWAGFWCKGR